MKKCYVTLIVTEKLDNVIVPCSKFKQIEDSSTLRPIESTGL
jgi:hypothetical protein